jgi:DnaK suppressor protein
MAKKKDNKKPVKKAKPAAPVKKASKPGTKSARPAAGKSSAAKSAKPAPKKSNAPKAVKPAAKKSDNKMSKTASKNSNTKSKNTKPVAKKGNDKKKPELKKPAKAAVKAAPKPVKKPAGKPIDAIAKNPKGKPAATSKKDGKGGSKGDEEADVEVKDDYEKTEEEDGPIDATLDEAGMIDLEGAVAPEIDEDDDEVPEKRGRGRRKKNEGKSSGGTMEAYIRNRPLQIDINKPLIKKGNVAAPKPFVNTEDKRTRYSDKELAEFKELILEKLKEAQADYDLLKQTLSNEDNHGTDDTSPSFKLLEDGSDVMSKEETAQLASRQEKYIVNLKNALVRIENKAYGICRVTGKLIPKERLRSVPHATLGIDAKLNQS